MLTKSRGIRVSEFVGDALVIALVVLALVAITLADSYILPNHNLTILYAIPVLLAALRASPRVVLTVAVGSLAIDALESALHDDIYYSWPIRTAVLVAVFTFAVLIASQRQELASRSRALLEAHARLRSILDNAANAILFVERGSDQLIVNSAAHQLFGSVGDEGIDVRTAMERLIRPDGSPLNVFDWPSRVALSGATLRSAEMLVQRPTGERIPVLVSAAPTISGDGQTIGAVIVAQEIIAVKELQRRREEWTSIIAHDLRQPITTIVGYASLLVRMASYSAPDFVAPADHILTSARQMNRMIADLLDVSHLETSRLVVKKQSIDLGSFVSAVVERVGEATLGHPVHLAIGEGIPPVEADPGRLEQVLGNLLSNAAKYGNPDTVIQVQVACQSGAVEVAVTNQGPGISKEALPRLFQRYYRTPSAREGPVAGLGLGLYITKGLVEAHGGQIRVNSTPGAETTFAFTLPVHATTGRLDDDRPSTAPENAAVSAWQPTSPRGDPSSEATRSR